jgi:sulfite reductase alpha subunit-like flavoprotein
MRPSLFNFDCSVVHLHLTLNMTKDNQKGHFLLVYGSQTGQAKAIAEELSETASSRGLAPNLVCFGQYEKKV